MKRTLSRAAAALCLALALFFLLPLCAGILHFGCLLYTSDAADEL